MTTNSIQVDHISYSYRHAWTGRKIDILKDISFAVKTGSCFGLLGHNGAGKTSTIKCLLGLVKPDRGSILVNGKQPADSVNRIKLGYIPEQPYFYDHLKVRELVELAARLSRVEEGNVKTSVDKALKIAGLVSRETTPLRVLSKGLQQRVALAQAICHDPSILVLDEPFSGLDPLGRREFREIFLNLKKEGRTILISTHLMSDVEVLCDEVGILKTGSLRGLFPLADVLDNSNGKFEVKIKGQLTSDERLVPCSEVRSFQFDQYDSASQFLEKAIREKVEVVSFSKESGSLEELFVSLVST